jgi:hypothetical protein
MEGTRITARRAIELLREVVAGREDYVYRSPEGYDAESEKYNCQYWHGNDDCPGCLIGAALHQAGVSAANLLALPQNRISATDVLLALQDLAGVTLTDDARDIFQMAQSAQDLGSPWGDALRRAEARFLTVSNPNNVKETVAA